MKPTLGRRKEDHKLGGHLREDRFFQLENNWYFTTREGVVMGPFDSREVAEQEVQTFIDFMKAAQGPVTGLIKKEKMTIGQEAEF